MGKKYIVEIGRLERLYKAHINGNGMPNITWLSPEVDLTPYTEPDMEQVRKEMYDKGYDDAAEEKYNDGLADAWDAVRKIALMDTETSENVTGYFGLFRIMENLTPMQAIEKIRQYEQEKEEIQVGDEIVRSNGEKYVVLIVNDERKLVTILRHDGYERTIESKWVTKTGRHFPEIAEVLKKMRETE